MKQNHQKILNDVSGFEALRIHIFSKKIQIISCPIVYSFTIELINLNVFMFIYNLRTSLL